MGVRRLLEDDGSAALIHPTLAGRCRREREADFGALRLSRRKSRVTRER
jgi:hypothetical protein